jgi:hypothetical protein
LSFQLRNLFLENINLIYGTTNMFDVASCGMELSEALNDDQAEEVPRDHNIEDMPVEKALVQAKLCESLVAELRRKHAASAS